MTTIDRVAALLETLAPCWLAEDWDNVGLLVGRADRAARRIMTCLTITPATVREAAARRADLIVSHHPLPFRALKRITADSTSGRLLLDLIEAGVAVISPHTAFDSAARGINDHWARGLGLEASQPLVPRTEPAGGGPLGTGRWGRLSRPTALVDLARQVRRFLRIDRLRIVGRDDQVVQQVAVACGSGGDLLAPARQAGCDCLVTGETGFHTCLEAEALGIALVLPGHFASERFAVEWLADYLRTRLDGEEIWASENERDPLRWVV